MGISLQVAEEKLHILKRIPTSPELILTELFSCTGYDVRALNNFLLQVYTEERKPIYIVLKEYLRRIPVFGKGKGMLSYAVNFKGNSLNMLTITVSDREDMEGMYTVKNIEVARLDMAKKTFAIRAAGQEISEKLQYIPRLEQKELDEFYKKYEDVSMANRVRNAVAAMVIDHAVHIRLKNAWFALTCPAKRLNIVVEREKGKVEEWNQYAQKRYKEELLKHARYKELAPRYQNEIRNRQESIRKYLKELGYKEVGMLKMQEDSGL